MKGCQNGVQMQGKKTTERIERRHSEEYRQDNEGGGEYPTPERGRAKIKFIAKEWKQMELGLVAWEQMELEFEESVERAERRKETMRQNEKEEQKKTAPRQVEARAGHA